MPLPTITDRYVPCWDGLRGLAALTIVLFHPLWQNPLSTWGFIRQGHLMVDVFSVLSGVVMAHTYLGRVQTWGDAGRYI